MTLLALDDVGKSFTVGRWPKVRRVRAVDGVTLSIAPGAALGLVGESGSGKSTVARLVLRLTEPSRGRILFQGQNIAAIAERDMAPIRRSMQLVQQNPHSALDPRRTIFASIAEPLVVLEGLGGSALKTRVVALMRDVALPDAFLWRYPHELSGGQKQRVAIARALINDPLVILGDEPTGNLDQKNGEIVFDIFKELAETYHQALLIVTHDTEFAAKTHRIIEMEDGRII